MREHRLLELQRKNAIEIVLISKEQHWRFSAKRLEEVKTTRLQGWQEKPRGMEKLKRILFCQVNG